MQHVTLVTVDNETIKVFDCYPETEDKRFRVAEYNCIDGKTAIEAAEYLSDLFADEWRGSGYIYRDTEEVAQALSFYLNTQGLIRHTETGNVNPMHGKNATINPGITKIQAQKVKQAMQWLEDNPDSRLGAQKAAKLADVTMSTMRRAMINLNRLLAPKRTRESA